MRRYNRIKEEWDIINGEFLIIGYPTVMLSSRTFVRIQKDAERILGEGAAIIFYEAGKKVILESIERFQREWKLEGEELVRGLEEFYAELGFGKFKTGKPGEEMLIKIENSFIAKEYGKSEAPVCHFLRGYCAGISEILTGEKMDAEETKCLAKGDSYCEFVARPAGIE